MFIKVVKNVLGKIGPQLYRWLRWWSLSVMRPRRLPADLGKVAAVALSGDGQH